MRTCIRCENTKKSQHEHCAKCERKAFPGVAILREVMARTRIPCACGKVAGYVVNFRPVCSACRDALRITDCTHRKDWREKRGLCRECGKEAVEGRKHCEPCLRAGRNRFALWKLSGDLTSKKAKRAEQSRLHRAKLKAAGLCQCCRAPTIGGASRCLKCQARDTAAHAERDRLRTRPKLRKQGPTMDDLYGGRADMVAPNGEFSAGVDFETLSAMNHNYVSKY